MLITSHILSTTGVNNCTYQHAMLIKIVMLTRKLILIWYALFLAKIRWIYARSGRNAGVTPFQLGFYTSPYLVENFLVNIMFCQNRLIFQINAVINTWVTIHLLCVMCNSIICYVLLSVNSYIYNALVFTSKACIDNSRNWVIIKQLN